MPPVPRGTGRQAAPRAVTASARKLRRRQPTIGRNELPAKKDLTLLAATMGAIAALAGAFVGGAFTLRSTEKTVSMQLEAQSREAQRAREEVLRESRKKVYEEYIEHTNADVRQLNDLAFCMAGKTNVPDTTLRLMACGFASYSTSNAGNEAASASDLLFIYGSEQAIIKASAMDVARAKLSSVILAGTAVGIAQQDFFDAKEAFLRAACADVNPGAQTACLAG